MLPFSNYASFFHFFLLFYLYEVPYHVFYLLFFHDFYTSLFAHFSVRKGGYVRLLPLLVLGYSFVSSVGPSGVGGVCGECVGSLVQAFGRSVVVEVAICGTLNSLYSLDYRYLCKSYVLDFYLSPILVRRVDMELLTFASHVSGYGGLVFLRVCRHVLLRRANVVLRYGRVNQFAKGVWGR